jgi:putative phage-type endonuclease
MSDAPAIMLDPRRRWLAERRELLTASDCAAVLGLDPFRSPLSVYASKVAGVEADETGPMRRGKRLEPVIADEYAEATGRPVYNPGAFEIVRHPDIPWLGATLDRITAGSDLCPAPAPGRGAMGVPPEMRLATGDTAPLEIKAPRDAHGWEDDAAPLHYEIQLQIQIACTRATWGSLAALLGLDAEAPAVRDRLPHPRALAGILPRLEEFWRQVERREPPAVQGLPGEADAVAALWADENGETVELDADALELVEKWSKAKARASEGERDAKALRTALAARMGSASFGRLPDGSWLTFHKQARAGYTAAPTTFRAIKRVWKFKGRR